MTDKVQKIREEVEKLKLCTMDEHMKFYSESAEAEYYALCKVEEIIDSLQEESKFKVGQYLKQGDTIVKILEVSDDGYHCDNAFIPFSAQDKWELVKEPVSKIWHDMSDEAENGRNTIIIDPKGFYGAVLRKGGSRLRNHNKERYVKWAYIDDIINITNKEEPVSEELSEYINELSKQFPEVSFAKLSRIAVRVAKWQEQKYKEALNIYLNSQWNKGK